MKSSLRTSKHILFMASFLIGLLICQNARAACLWDGNTGTVNFPYDDSDVAACVADAATKSGHVIIRIPACNVTWDAIVTINMSDWTHVTSLTITGAEKTGTVITSGSWTVTTKTTKNSGSPT